MTEEQYFTTSEIIKITSLKLSTVQRYIRTFMDFFSSGARLPDRRRRFTSQDIKTLLLIKYLYSIRESKSEITKSLRGEKVVPSVSWIEITHALEIAMTAEKAKKDCEDIYRKMKADLHRQKCFIQDRVSEFRRISAIVITEAHDTRVALESLITKQNADSRMQFENIRALEQGHGLNDVQKRNLRSIVRILEYEQEQRIINKRQRTAADNLVKQREAQLEKTTGKKRANKFIDSIGMTLYKYSLPKEERWSIELQELKNKWNENHDNEEQME